MKLLIETCLSDFFIGLVNDKNEFADYIHEKKLQKKSERLPDSVREILKKNKLDVSDLTGIYITKGPGSFMGVRAGLMYGATLARITNTPLFTVNTMKFISGGKPGKYFLDAKSDESFMYEHPKNKVRLVKFEKDTPMDYKELIKNPKQYLDLFDLTKPGKALPEYFKEPRVG